MGSWISIRTFLVPSITYILVMKLAWAVFKKITFFDFSKFVHNIYKKKFSSWYFRWIYFVMGATYSRNMDQIRAGAPRPCLSCYGFNDFLSISHLQKTLLLQVFNRFLKRFCSIFQWFDSLPNWKIVASIEFSESEICNIIELIS